MIPDLDWLCAWSGEDGRSSRHNAWMGLKHGFIGADTIDSVESERLADRGVRLG